MKKHRFMSDEERARQIDTIFKEMKMSNHNYKDVKEPASKKVEVVSEEQLKNRLIDSIEVHIKHINRNLEIMDEFLKHGKPNEVLTNLWQKSVAVKYLLNNIRSEVKNLNDINGGHFEIQIIALEQQSRQINKELADFMRLILKEK
ncbi:MAG: hypothetical protein QXL02_03025 [Candidatus Anstonellales archaeon]